jgi:GTP cyclohydrolase II
MHRPLHQATVTPTSAESRDAPAESREATESSGKPLRNARRAVLDARNGLPIILNGIAPLVVLPAESATADGLHEWRAASAAPGVLLLAPTRAAAVLHQPVAPGAAAAISLPAGALDAATLLALADPTQPQGAAATSAPVPALAEAALMLAKLGRLLPAVLAAPAVPGGGAGLLRVDAADVLAYPAQAAGSLTKVAEARVPLEEAPEARLAAFRPADGGMEHLALLIGRPEAAAAPLVRIHSECFTGDALGSLRCDCGPQLSQAITRMAAEGAGVLLYMAQEGRGIGLVNKLRAYALQDAGLDTLDANRALGWGADERSFAPAATMLKLLGIGRIRLLTNNPDKIATMRACGIDVAGRVSHAIAANGVNDAYLETKARRFGHLPG